MEKWMDAEYPVTEQRREPINDMAAVKAAYPQSGVAADGFQIEFAMTTQGVVVGGMTLCGSVSGE